MNIFYDEGPSFIAANWILTGLSIIFVSLRVLTRAVVVRTWYLDDYLIVLALVRSCEISTKNRPLISKFRDLLLPARHIIHSQSNLAKLFHEYRQEPTMILGTIWMTTLSSSTFQLSV